jgi:hypothetical protein
MPSSSSRKRQEPELVELAPGVAIPHHFVGHDPTGHGAWTVEIVTDPDTKVPRWISRCERAPADGVPVVDVADEPWRRRMEDAIAQQAGRVVSRRFSREKGWAISEDFEQHFPEVAVPPDAPRIDSAAVSTAEETARQAVRPKPGRRPVADDEKLRVLELYRTKGIAETMAITGKAERTVRRYIADAQRIERGER